MRILGKTLIYVVTLVALYLLATTAIYGYLGVQDDKSKHNGTYGKIEYVDIYKDFNVFELDLKDVVFYKGIDGYVYSKEFDTVIDFDGTSNKFNLLINNTPCNTTISNAGQLYGIWHRTFDDLNGIRSCDFTLNIRFQFTVSKIILTVETKMTEKDFGYLVQFINVNGFKLRIIDEQYNASQNDVIDTCYVYYHNQLNGELMGVKSFSIGSKITVPKTLAPVGHYFSNWKIDGKTISLLNYELSGNVHIYGTLTVETFTVYLNDGNITRGYVTVPYGEKISNLSIYQYKIGHTFGGWSLTNGGAIIDVSNYVIKSSITLYSNWTEVPPDTTQQYDFTVSDTFERFICEKTFNIEGVKVGYAPFNITANFGCVDTYMGTPLVDSQVVGIGFGEYLEIKVACNFGYGISFEPVYVRFTIVSDNYISIDYYSDVVRLTSFTLTFSQAY